MKKKPTEWERIFVSYIFDWRLISRIYKELKKMKRKKEEEEKEEEGAENNGEKIDQGYEERVLKRKDESG